MKLLSRRCRQVLADLQDEVRRLSLERSAALRMFAAARVSTTASAQEEFWLEFLWLNQEYRYAVRRLAEFCEQLGDGTRTSYVRQR